MLTSLLPLPDRLTDDPRPLLLCLAGNTVSPRVFAPALEAFEPDVLVIGADYLHSIRTGDFETLVASLVRVVERRAAKTVLIGHSAGAALAIAAAGDLGNRLAALVACSTGPNTQGHSQQALDPVASIDPANLLALLFPGSPLTPEIRDDLLAYAAGLVPDTVIGLFTTLRQVDLTPTLPEITCPTLVVHGTHDPRRPVGDGKLLASGIPRARLAVLQAGHNPMLEAPRQFRLEVAKLLAATGMTAT